MLAIVEDHLGLASGDNTFVGASHLKASVNGCLTGSYQKHDRHIHRLHALFAEGDGGWRHGYDGANTLVTPVRPKPRRRLVKTCEGGKLRFRPLMIPDTFVEQASQADMYAAAHLDRAGIVKTVLEARGRDAKDMPATA